MISNSPVSATGIGGYHFKEDGKEAPGHWLGKSAKELQLQGEVQKEDLMSVARGKAPNGIQIKAKRTSLVDGIFRDLRRAGTDSVFSPPKSASIVGLVGKDSRVVEAHRYAVEQTLKEVEETCAIAKVRTGGVRRNEFTGNILVAAFDHTTTRPDSKGIADPQIHTHAIIFNSTKCNDGIWRSLENWKFFDKDKKRIRKFYIRELGEQLKDIDYKVKYEKEGLSFSIEGITHEQEMVYSTRRKAILSELDKEFLTNTERETGFRATRFAALKTRNSKESVKHADLDRDWDERATKAGIKFECIKGYVETPEFMDPGLADKLRMDVIGTIEAIKMRTAVRLKKVKAAISEPIQSKINQTKEDYQKTFGTLTQAEMDSVTDADCLEFIRPSHLSQEHWHELVNESRIKPAIASRSFETVDGDDAKELVIGHALSKVGAHGQQHATKETQGILNTYKDLEHGGLWCKGAGEWGELKANVQRMRAKKGRDGQYKRDADGQPIKEPVKYDPVYQMPKGVTLPQSNEWHWDAISKDVSIPVGITEGAKKAASVSSQGLMTVGIAGLTGGVKDGELNHELKKINWRGRKVYLVLDKDPHHKRDVQRNASIELFKMASLLENKGATVTIGTIPGPHDQKVGMDDHFVAGGNLADIKWQSLNEFVETSPHLPEKYKKMNVKRLALGLGNADELPYLAEGNVDGESGVKGSNKTITLADGEVDGKDHNNLMTHTDSDNGNSDDQAVDAAPVAKASRCPDVAKDLQPTERSTAIYPAPSPTASLKKASKRTKAKPKVNSEGDGGTSGSWNCNGDRKPTEKSKPGTKQTHQQPADPARKKPVRKSKAASKGRTSLSKSRKDKDSGMER